MLEPFAAQVMALEANYLRVRLDHPGPDGRRLLLCTRRARLAHGGLKVMVGDRVGVEGCDWGEGRTLQLIAASGLGQCGSGARGDGFSAAGHRS